VEKGRHRRFEEARKLKLPGPGPCDLGFGDRVRQVTTTQDEGPSEEDEYAALAEKYGVEFDEDAEPDDD